MNFRTSELGGRSFSLQKIKEVIQIVRGHKEKKPGEMTVFTRCKDLIAYTLQITNNPKRFPKKIRFTITNRLQDMSLLMYENLLMANEIIPIELEDVRERKRYQRKTLALSKQVLFLIEICLEHDRIEINSANYWVGLVEEVQMMTAKWMESDSRRFRDL